MKRYLSGYVAAAAPIVAALGLGAAAVAAGPAPTAPTANSAVVANDQLRCVGRDDAAGIDAVLTAAGSPLAGDGRAIVDEATAAGIDPRFVVAIAAHETMLMTYGPAGAINNPFGLGPNMRFATHTDAVRYAAKLLGEHYVGEGRTTIPLIGSKWAPLGAANDPNGLNSHWVAGVSKYYRALGGDPLAPVTLDRQPANAPCTTGQAPGATPLPTPPAAGDGPPQIVVSSGTPPAVAGSGARDGADPATGQAAHIPGFVFPLAVPANAEVRFTTAACTEPAPCSTPLESAPLAYTVAATGGVLTPADAAQQQAGVAFWIVRADGDRVGYGALASYEPGIQAGATVTAGQPLGRSTGVVTFTWQRQGVDINPRPLLALTRPPAT